MGTHSFVFLPNLLISISESSLTKITGILCLNANPQVLSLFKFLQQILINFLRECKGSALLESLLTCFYSTWNLLWRHYFLKKLQAIRGMVWFIPLLFSVPHNSWERVEPEQIDVMRIDKLASNIQKIPLRLWNNLIVRLNVCLHLWFPILACVCGCESMNIK